MSRILGYAVSTVLAPDGERIEFVLPYTLTKTGAQRTVDRHNALASTKERGNIWAVVVVEELIDYWSKEMRDMDQQDTDDFLDDPLKGTLDEMK